MAESERPFSVTRVIAGLGGVLLVASFFLPLFDMKEDGLEAQAMFGVREMRQQIEASRETAAVQPLIEPALQQVEVFARSPSLRNFSSVIASTKEIVDIVIGAGVAPPEARQLSTVLTATRWGLWLLPLVGAVQTLMSVVTRLRGYSGFVGLVSRFGFGLLFVLFAALPLLGASQAAQPYIGSAVYAALVGGLLMMIGGVFGVTRRNWIFVFLAEAGILAGVVYGVKILAEAIDKM